MGRSVSRDSPLVGLVALLLPVVIVASILSLVVFYAVGGVFGPLNDLGNAVIAWLVALLAVLLRRPGGLAWVGVAAALAGAVVASYGSWLVMSGTSGFVLAGFASTVGYGLLGVWLAMASWSATADEWPRAARLLGRVSAVMMVVGGAAALPAWVQGIDDFAGLPGWMWTFSLCFQAMYLLVPVWSFLVGRAALARRPE